MMTGEHLNFALAQHLGKFRVFCSTKMIASRAWIRWSSPCLFIFHIDRVFYCCASTTCSAGGGEVEGIGRKRGEMKGKGEGVRKRHRVISVAAVEHPYPVPNSPAFDQASFLCSMHQKTKIAKTKKWSKQKIAGKKIKKTFYSMQTRTMHVTNLGNTKTAPVGETTVVFRSCEEGQDTGTRDGHVPDLSRVYYFHSYWLEQFC